MEGHGKDECAGQKDTRVTLHTAQMESHALLLCLKMTSLSAPEGFTKTY